MSGRGDTVYRRRVIVATSIGNALEWFDFVVYGFFAALMARLFFPSSDPTTALLLTFATFGVPFLARPLGAVVLGGYGDRHGRKAALLLSIGLMTAGTFMIAVTPTYSAIGPWAAAIVVTARTIQAFSVGSEYGPALTFLAEQDPQRRGFLASWHYASQSITGVLATGFGVALNALLTPESMEAWGWRIPFVFGLLIGPVGYYMRRHLSETPAFMATRRSSAPMREVLAGHWREILICGGVIVVSAITIYANLFMPTFAIRQLGLPPALSFTGSLLASIIQVSLIPVVGWWSDRLDRVGLALAGAIGVLVIAYPLFAWLVAVPTLATLIMAQALLALVNAINLGCVGGLVASLFATKVRTSGLSVANALAVTLLGGPAPFIQTWLIQATGNPTAPSFYLIFAAAISIVALLAMRRSARHMPSVAREAKTKRPDADDSRAFQLLKRRR